VGTSLSTINHQPASRLLSSGGQHQAYDCGPKLKSIAGLQPAGDRAAAAHGA